MSPEANRARRYRDRLKRGIQVATVEVPSSVVPVLIRAGVLENGENISGRELGNALLDYVCTHGKENPAGRQDVHASRRDAPAS
jgi:hypothetical protein